MYYNCVKFHKNPISCLGGVVLTRYMDGRTDRVIPIYPPKLCLRGDNNIPVISWQSVLLVEETEETTNLSQVTSILMDNWYWVWFMVFNTTFNNISAILWRSVFFWWRNRSTRRKPSTCRKSTTCKNNIM